jgi:hypothetical protein
MDGNWVSTSNTDAFYSIDETSGELVHGPNFVLNMDYELRREHKDTYEYPVHGWYWFDSQEEARIFFNLPPAE